MKVRYMADARGRRGSLAQAAAVVELANRRLSDLVYTGAYHAGGRRSQSRWIYDLNAPGMGYWVRAWPNTEERAHAKRIDAALARIFARPVVALVA